MAAWFIAFSILSVVAWEQDYIWLSGWAAGLATIDLFFILAKALSKHTWLTKEYTEDNPQEDT
jgi:hypothetical protein